MCADKLKVISNPRQRDDALLGRLFDPGISGVRLDFLLL